MEPKQQEFSVGYYIVALIALFVIQSVLFAPHARHLVEKEVVDRDGLAQLLAEATS